MSAENIKQIFDKHKISVYYGCLFLHDYLWFSSSEISRISTTIPVIHNYALTYALSQFSYAIRYTNTNTPSYFEDIAKFNCYATPAISIGSRKEIFTYNALNDILQTTGRQADKFNSPKFGKKTVVIPEFVKISDKEKLTGFKFYVFVWNDLKLPSVIRLGKKNAQARIFWELINFNNIIFSENEEKPSHPLNPNDINGEITRGDIVKIPPHSFYRFSWLKNDWFIKTKYHCIQIPKIIFDRFNDDN